MFNVFTAKDNKSQSALLQKLLDLKIFLFNIKASINLAKHLLSIHSILSKFIISCRVVVSINFLSDLNCLLELKIRF